MTTDRFNRRHLLQAALGGGAFFLLPHLARAQGASGESRPFSFDRLRDTARDLAARPHVPDDIPDADILDQVDYDRHNQVRFRADRSLWRGQGRISPVQPFFPGMYFRNPVRIHTVQDGMATEVPFSLDLFDIPEGHPARQLTRTKGFAGFRVQDAETEIDWMAFLGASYWRTSGYSGQFGLSARGLAIDTAIPDGPEEFPLFTHFWLEPAENGDLTAYALLDSPRATGAYRIVSRRGDGVSQDITATVFLRDAVERLGIAPLTSMFWFGKTDRHIAPDWRPEVHDSDGLEILSGNGERIWRPLNNPPGTMVNSFDAPSVKGFGLMQRERDFAQYQDDGVFYDRRASAWITPQGDWGDGAVVLTELRTDDEIHDNIVAFWQPAGPTAKGQSHDFAYRLDWVRDNPAISEIGHFTAVRLGAGGVPGQPRPKDVVKVVCDFAGPNLAGLGREDGLTIAATTAQARVSNTAVYPVVGTDDWRALFDLSFGPGDDPIDLRAYVDHKGTAMTETLILQLFPSQLRALLASTP
ncbi:glucan biosynthesis protein D [Paracoccus sp. S3-43]|uniref:glucan biosynthesis protein n=1 Tax=Paracoccus sp. S3-43 TaxID=3030011 RepID=UPI0023B14CB7|nr:glucan biosynthesis protein D [Paracoccus sp. S3-43]WEF24211.1 glucan biosynthesis protein D [Paracoccus sp. S3-43]